MPRVRTKPGNQPSEAHSARDRRYMKRALAEASKGLGCTRPNPAVGAVLVKGGRLLGVGFHRGAGAAHAEVEALRTVREGAARGATIYVTLEPCDHWGRTGPCSKKLIEAGVARVVVGSLDPNRAVAGRGLRRLRAAGIEVSTGILEPQCRQINEGYFKHVRSGRPLVLLKAAASLDGRLATRRGESAGLTGAEAHAHLHQLRASCDAILVGIGTVLVDNPRLDVRIPGLERSRPHPLVRVVVDSRARTPPRAKVVRGPGEVIIATTARAPRSRIRALEQAGAEVLVCRPRRGQVSLADLFIRLGRRDLMSVLVEGGGQIHGSLLRDGQADRAIVYLAPRLIGGDGVPLAAGSGRARLDATRLSGVEWQRLGDDMVMTGWF